MEDYRRPPTANERTFAIIACGMLSVLLAALAVFIASEGFWLASAVPAGLVMVLLTILYRAASGPRRALSAKETTAVAWCFLLVGTGGIALALLVGGAPQHRLMALAGLVPILFAGLSWLRGRRGGV